MTNNTAVLDMAPVDPNLLRPHLKGYSSAALPISGIAALGMFLASRLGLESLTTAVILILPLGCLCGYRAIRYLKKGVADSIVGFTICAALLVGAALPTINQWIKIVS
jgi:hypothetical protein